MQDILIRIETDDFAAWAEQHYLHAGNRATYGIEDGPAYRDLENPNAALVPHQDRGRRPGDGMVPIRDVQSGDETGKGDGAGPSTTPSLAAEADAPGMRRMRR